MYRAMYSYCKYHRIVMAVFGDCFQIHKDNTKYTPCMRTHLSNKNNKKSLIDEL